MDQKYFEVQLVSGRKQVLEAASLEDLLALLDRGLLPDGSWINRQAVETVRPIPEGTKPTKFEVLDI